MGIAKNTFLLLALILINNGLFAQENKLPNKYKELKEMRDRVESREDVIERRWKNVLKAVKSEELLIKQKKAVVQKFIDDFPQKNKYLKEAEKILSKLKAPGDSGVNYVRSEKFRTKPEWIALSFFAGNYGVGAGLTLVTLRSDYVFWEILRLQGTGGDFLINNMRGFSVNAKTMVGIPIFLGKTYRHEIRISAGFSGGVSTQWDKYREGDINYLYMGLFNFAFDISYVFHIKENFAFQIGAALDLPIVFDEFYPVVNGFIGFRI